MVCILKEPHHREELVCFALGSVREMLKKNLFPEEHFLFNVFHQLPTLCRIITLYLIK